MRFLRIRKILLLVGALVELMSFYARFEFIVFLTGIAFLIGGVAMIYLGIDCCRGENSRWIKKNSKILELMDDIENAPVYEKVEKTYGI